MNNDLINKYCLQHSNEESELQRKIRDWTYKNERYPQMISGLMVGNILSFLIKSISAKKILEVGMFTGYSAASMAKVLPEDGEIHTCEYMDEHIQTAKNFFRKTKYENIIKIYDGPAINSLENFKVNTFDFAFIDADKTNYLNYYLRCMHLIKLKRIIVLDNMTWSGKVINPKDEDAKKLREVGDYIQNDKRVFNILLPIRDGLMICIKK